MKIKPQKLIYDVETRWSSTYLMIDRALHLKLVCNTNILLNILLI